MTVRLCCLRVTIATCTLEYRDFPCTWHVSMYACVCVSNHNVVFFKMAEGFSEQVVDLITLLTTEPVKRTPSLHRKPEHILCFNICLCVLKPRHSICTCFLSFFFFPFCQELTFQSESGFLLYYVIYCWKCSSCLKTNSHQIKAGFVFIFFCLKIPGII